MSDNPRVPARKKPSQKRSRSLVDAILTGAARILAKARSDTPLSLADEGRTTPMTTNKIAEVAGVSIGSLYQYCPGKKAILAALLERRLRDTYDALLARVDRDQVASLDEAVSELVDAFIDLKLEHESIDAGLVEEALRQGLTGEAFSLTRSTRTASRPCPSGGNRSSAPIFPPTWWHTYCFRAFAPS